MIKCPLPWTGIAVDPDGSVKNCAVSRRRLGNIKDTPVEKIVNGPANYTIQNHLRKGSWPGSCQACEQREAVDVKFSNRSFQLELHKNLPDSIYSTNQHYLTQLDLRWSNTCNYACVYCSPDLSSLWARELGKDINVDRNELVDFKEYVFANLDNLVEVYLAGGEPLIIKENLELLEKLYDRNPNALVRITTNLSTLKGNIYQAIKKFPNVQWEISIDAMNDIFEYIRYPGIWHEVESNLRQLLAEWPGDKIGITMNYLLLNCDTIIETGQHLINLGIDKNRIAVHYLTKPEFLDARNLNEKNKLRILDYLNTYNEDTTFGTSLRNCHEFLAKEFDRKPNNVVYSLNAIDKRRNLNFSNIFPNLLENIK